MGEIASYVYTVGPLCWAALVGFGGLIVTLSTQHLRLARAFFLLSALPIFAVPITFGYTASSALVGLSVAAVSAFIFGMIYYVGISILNDHLSHADKAAKKQTP